MSALSFARQAFGREKPHSSITDWVDILTSSNIEEEAYDGIPELVESINLQTAAGTAEASRALRKKLKHGNSHQQYRSLVILKALVENCGKKFTSSFADGQLIDVLKNMSVDTHVDKRVRKKLILVLASWHDQFKSDPSMALIAGLHKQCSREGRRQSHQEVAQLIGVSPEENLRRKEEKEETKRQARKEKEQAKARKEEEERQRRLRETRGQQSTRTPFVFEKEKPKVLASIVDASQASSNLVNAITLVNPATDSLQTNERVQECLTKARQIRKTLIRYIQLVENEELIGTLIETNERVLAAIGMYEKLSVTQTPESEKDVTSAITAGLAAARLDVPSEQVDIFQERQRTVRTKQAGEVEGHEEHEAQAHLHPDLQDLNLGALGASSHNLQPPLRPSTRSDDGKEEAYDVRGSLSDFSDYSSDEDMHDPSRKRGGRNYVNVSDDEEPYARAPLTQTKDDDPFADPFADSVAVGPSKRW